MKRGLTHQQCLKKLHDLTPDNVWVRKDGKRYCRACRRKSRHDRYLTLDEKTKLALPEKCDAGHLIITETIRKIGTNKRKLKTVCLICLEDEDYQYDNPFGTPLLNSNGDRIKWGVLTEINFW